VAYLSARPGWNAQLRTTCVVTMIEGGHAANALPQRAKATIICRLLPNDDAAAVERTLASLAGEKVTLKREKFSQPNPPSPMRPDVMGRSRRSPASVAGRAVCGDVCGRHRQSVPAQRRHTDVRCVWPVQRGGRIPAHGRDERVLVRSLYESREFMYRLVRELSE